VTGVTADYSSIKCSVIQGRKNDYPSRWKSINELRARIQLILFYEVVMKGIIAKLA
jgi:hypothetical protein